MRVLFGRFIYWSAGVNCVRKLYWGQILRSRRRVLHIHLPRRFVFLSGIFSVHQLRRRDNISFKCVDMH